MADTSSKADAPIASGGLLASLANTLSNGTIGRIKTVVCTREDPTGQGESFASERLRERSQQYADHASGRAPLPPEISLWLRGEIDRLSQIVSPGQTSMWPDYSPAEKAYLAQQKAARRRAANDLGIAVGGPVFSALPAAARELDAPEQTVEDLGRFNAEIAAAAGLGRAGRGIEPVRVPTRMPQTSQTWRSPGNGVVVAANKVIPGFNAVESGVIREAQGILGSAELGQIRAAHVAGDPLAVRIGGRLILYEPGLPASGMTMFGEDGFLIGREAFVSQAELQKTVLHELYRLSTSTSGAGVSGALAAHETKAAFDFAARAAKQLGGN